MISIPYSKKTSVADQRSLERGHVLKNINSIRFLDSTSYPCNSNDMFSWVGIHKSLKIKIKLHIIILSNIYLLY